MTTAEIYIGNLEFIRPRTLALLDTIEKEPDPRAVLAWRPGPGRAHIGWQLMHIGITEELFASERLVPGAVPAYPDLVPRFKFGSTPDDDVPESSTIRRILGETRGHLVATLRTIRDDQLGEIPPALAARQLTLLDVLKILGWHEAHHHGQAHITLNLYRASRQ